MMQYDEPSMSTWAWFFTLLVLAIPFVNLVMYVVWACGVGNRNRVTFCRATLLWVAVGVVFYALCLVGPEPFRQLLRNTV